MTTHHLPQQITRFFLKKKIDDMSSFLAKKNKPGYSGLGFQAKVHLSFWVIG